MKGGGGREGEHPLSVPPLQKKNPAVRYLRNVAWEVKEIIPDFILGRTCCALFLRSVGGGYGLPLGGCGLPLGGCGLITGLFMLQC